jgi:hypothetical protein
LITAAIVALGARTGRAQTPPPQAAPAQTAPAQVAPPQWPPPNYPLPSYPPAYYPPPRLVQPMAAWSATGPRVTLNSDSVRPMLQHLGRTKWEDVCLTPCGVQVDPAGLYRIGGSTVRKSDPFQLPRASGDVLIDVEAGSNTKHFVGLGLMIGGAVSFGYGSIFWLLFHSTANSDPYSTTQASDNRAARDIAIFFGAITAILEGIGIPLLLSSTSVTVH